MTKITNQEHQYGELAEGDKVALYVNESLFKEYTVSVGNKGTVIFNYQEKEVVITE